MRSDDLLAKALLKKSKVIAVVGASRDPRKAAHSAPLDLKEHGFRIIPVNPNVTDGEKIWGEQVYRTLKEIPFPVDFVDVFRPAPETPEVVRQAHEIGAPAIWLQLGIRSLESRDLAEKFGMEYVENQCVAIVRARHQIESG